MADTASSTPVDGYRQRQGRVLLSGVQALVRLTLEQRWLDQERGLSTRVFVCGYPGSPLAGLDIEMRRAAGILTPAGIVVRPGLNEELAATAVAGTQLLDRLPGRRHEGITAFWYGKNPGLDRAADAIRHATLSGTAPRGGAVAWIGDDPDGKSSTVPSSCELMATSLSMPLFAPGTVGEIVELGLHAVAMSRAAGLWTGMKIVADVADASATVELRSVNHLIPEPPPARTRDLPILLGPAAVEAETDLLTRRLGRARSYARAAGLTATTFDPGRSARLGIIASGYTYQVLARALANLRLDETAMGALGLRIIRSTMPCPIDPATLTRLLDGLQEVLVVEDKVPFLEAGIKQTLYGHPASPTVTGRHDQAGRPLLSPRGQVTADEVAGVVASRIAAVCGTDRVPTTILDRLRINAQRPGRRPVITAAPAERRTPHFCSGCPHTTSTRTEDTTLVGVGIGCHAMVALNPAGRGHHVGLTQMGGEGAHWIGMAPFTDDRHFVQNLGDGTFHHSGSLAIRAAVAAGVNITYKLLYNEAVAMTGGQQVEGMRDVAALTRLLALEGVRRIVVTTDDPHSYRSRAIDPIATVRHRSEIAAAQRELSELPGVTVLIHDDRCAAEERRLRRRGELPTPSRRVVINERVCEGCGDCGELSGCLSVQPVMTEFGRKTRIHQPSCNFDYTCTSGDCPSFLLVTAPAAPARPAPQPPVRLVEPARRLPRDELLIRMAGVGGTGVITVARILQTAAHLDGMYAAGLEQTGLAQKGGPVVSDVRISTKPVTGAPRASEASVDVLIGFDLIGAADPQNLRTADRRRTVAVVNTALVPTAAMITDPGSTPNGPGEAIKLIDAATKSSSNLHLDAQALAETLFGDHLQANLVLLGAAYQQGLLPLSEPAITEAIRRNEVAVENNLAAFAWGRAAAVDPTAVAAATTPGKVRAAHPSIHALVSPIAAGGELAQVLTVRVNDLIRYQNLRYARRYAHDVRSLAAAAKTRAGAAAGDRVAVAYARGLHKFMAYKDEYEVAALHLATAREHRRANPGTRIRFLLRPPMLQRLGLRRKIRLGPGALPMFRLLRALRVLRGTPFDPFGRTAMRRLERELIGEYRQLVRSAVAHLDETTTGQVIAIVELAEVVRGYEVIKSANVERFRDQARRLLAALTHADTGAGSGPGTATWARPHPPGPGPPPRPPAAGHRGKDPPDEETHESHRGDRHEDQRALRVDGRGPGRAATR